MDSTNLDNKDRISALPDCLIHTILSFIDMRYAVQSSVLSKRWRYIWTSLPMLMFGVEEDYNVADFVDKVLWFRDSCCIQSFYLDACGEEDIDFTRIYSWIAVAVRRNVEELDISCRCDGDFVIPPCLCTSKSLKKMDLYVYNTEEEDRGKIILPTSASLPGLKSMSLSLENLVFDDEYLTNKFFSSCPALESLQLQNCEFINVSDSRNRESSSFTLTLCAPTLTTFDCSGYQLRDFSVENLSSIVTASIFLEVERDDTVPENCIELIPENRIEFLPEKKELYARRMMKLVRTLHNVESLILSEYFKVLSEAPEILNDQLPQFLNLRILGLQTWLSTECMHGIIFLLKISPNLKSLRLDITKIYSNKPSLFPFCDEINFDSRSQENYWDSVLSLPCVLYHLKFVRIQGLQGCVNELKVIEILLKNSMVLEKMVLSSDSDEKDPLTERRMLKFYEILLTFPKASTTCIISWSPRRRGWCYVWNF